MIDLSDVVNDSDLCQDFVVYRSSGEFGPDGWQPNIDEEIPMSGVVSVISKKELNMLPEGDRITSAMVFVTTQPMNLTHRDVSSGLSDKVMWHGEFYRLINSWNYSDYGFYKTVGVRIEGQ